MGKGLGVEFNSVSAQVFGCLDVGKIALHKERGADSCCAKLGQHLLQHRRVLEGIPAGIRSEHVGGVGDQGNLLGSAFEDQINKITAWVAFNVEFSADHSPQGAGIRIPDVAFVRTRMYGNSLGAKVLRAQSNLEYVGHIASSAVA